MPNNTDITWNENLEQTLTTLENGANCFITGPAGTGKSLLINDFCEHTNKRVLKLASTGCAAIHINGLTVHSAFHVPRGIIPPENSSFADEKVWNSLQEYDAIIIDEISMVRQDLFDYIYRSVKAIEFLKGAPIQLIVVGDFFQLPPVINRKEKSAFYDCYHSTDGYAFESQLWEKSEFVNIALKKNLRIHDDGSRYLESVNRLRMNDTSAIRELNSFVKKPTNNSLFLFPRTDEVKKYNQEMLDKLTSPKRSYYAVDNLGKNTPYPVDKVITITVGSRVVLLKNTNQYGNGDMGVVTKMSDNVITVQLDRGVSVEVKRYDWPIPELQQDGSVVMKYFTQFPISLAYAITIHKSQGMTLRNVAVDPTCFAPGQLYVALSRISDPNGLSLLKPIKEDYVISNPKVLDFYQRIDVA